MNQKKDLSRGYKMGKRKEVPETIVLDVYREKFSVSQDGSERGSMVVLASGSNFYFGFEGEKPRETFETVASTLVEDVEEYHRKRKGRVTLRYHAPAETFFTRYADGYFGRPAVCVGGISVRPLNAREIRLFKKVFAEMQKKGELSDHLSFD